MTNLTVLQQSNAKMSSREIATLCDKQHQHVKRDIETMCLQLDLNASKIGHIYLDSMNREQTEYLLDKETCLCLVAGYNAKLRMAIIKRWQELENQQMIDLSNPAFLRNLLLDYTEQNIALINENKVLTNALDNITNTKEAVKFQQACKILGIKQNVLAKWLRDNKWDRWINKSRASTHYSQKQGYCMTKFEEKDGVKASGEPYNFTCIEFFILPKGMAKLAKVFGDKAVA